MCVFWLNNNWYYSYGYIRRTTRVQYHIECTRRVCTCELCSASTGILVSVLPARRHLKNSTSSSAAAAVAPTTTSPRNQTETDYFVLKTQIIIFFFCFVCVYGWYAIQLDLWYTFRTKIKAKPEFLSFIRNVNFNETQLVYSVILYRSFALVVRSSLQSCIGGSMSVCLWIVGDCVSTSYPPPKNTETDRRAKRNKLRAR